MSDSILGGWRMIRPSDFETHTVEVANNQPICIACMALLPRFTTASGHVGWPFDHSSERDCRMNVAAPGGAQVCRNCITLDSSEHHFNRGSVDKPIPCVPVPPEYLDAARKHRVLARAVELCEKWDCPNIVIVEHTDNRTKIYGNLFNQIGGKSIKKFVRSQSRLPNVEKVENLTRDQVQDAYIGAHIVCRPINESSIPALAIQSSSNSSQDLAIFTSSLDGRSRVIQCLVPHGGNMPQNATFDAQPVRASIGDEESETTSSEEPSAEGEDNESMAGVQTDQGDSEGSEHEDSTEGSGVDGDGVDSDEEDSSDGSESEEA